LFFDSFKDFKLESNIIEFDCNSFPVGILKNEGIFLVSSLANKMRLGNYFNEIVTEKISPYDQIIFLYFIYHDLYDKAFQYAKKIEYKSSFTASLEWLLNTVLIDDDSSQFYVTIKERQKIDSNFILPKIVKFLKEFYEYPGELKIELKIKKY
jgi:hypothetical protein